MYNNNKIDHSLSKNMCYRNIIVIKSVFFMISSVKNTKWHFQQSDIPGSSKKESMTKCNVLLAPMSVTPLCDMFVFHKTLNKLKRIITHRSSDYELTDAHNVTYNADLKRELFITTLVHFANRCAKKHDATRYWKKNRCDKNELNSISSRSVCIADIFVQSQPTYRSFFFTFKKGTVKC